MRLRYAGVCRDCGTDLARRSEAEYDRETRTVLCPTCRDAGIEPSPTPTPQELISQNAIAEAAILQAPVSQGRAGESARREYERRTAQREKAVRTAHPKIGGFLLALSDEPQTTRAWERGAVGEERLGRRLDAAASSISRVLHDRRIPGTRANIDHMVVCPQGVVILDAKRYRGTPRLRVEGGFLSPRTEKLVVGRRNCTAVVDGVLNQVARVTAALHPEHADVPVIGMLCFIDADWPLIGGSFTTRGIRVLWPKRAEAFVTKPGPLTEAQISATALTLAERFPQA